MMTMLLINLIMSLMFLFLNHPMSMGLTLLIQTIMTALITGFFNINFWFSYILFLIMVGGMLVLFIYMTSIASNELFNYSNYLMFLMIMLIILLTMFYIKSDNFFIYSNFLFKETMDSYLNFNYYSLNKFFNYPSFLIIMMLITYLLITLIAIVKITKIESGPLRQSF